MLHQRWVVLSFIMAGLIVGLSMQAASASAFSQFAIPDTRLGPVTMSTALSALAGFGTMAALFRNRKAVSYTDEVIDELAKTTWPSKDETIRASTTVVITTLFVAALLGFYDYIWKNLADLVLLTEG